MFQKLQLCIDTQNINTQKLNFLIIINIERTKIKFSENKNIA